MEKGWMKYSKNKCIDCGKKISREAKRCRTCMGKSKKKYFDKPIKKDGTLSKDKNYVARKKWTEKNKEKNNQYKSNWIKRNPEKRRASTKKWDSKNMDKKRESIRRSAKKYPEKIKARNKSRYVKKGDICVFCGSKKYLERHHPNYSKPTLIITLCRKCHKKLHLKNGNWSTNK